jgi:hypothetical protein
LYQTRVTSSWRAGGRAEADCEPSLAPARRTEACRISARLVDDPRGVAQADHGGVRVAAVRDHLDARRAAGRGCVSVAGGDHERELGPARGQPGLDTIDRVFSAHYVEVTRAREAIDQVPAGGRAILVHEHGRDVVHVHGRGIPQGHQLDDGSDQEERDHLLVLAELEQLLHHDSPQHAHLRPPSG